MISIFKRAVLALLCFGLIGATQAGTMPAHAGLPGITTPSSLSSQSAPVTQPASNAEATSVAPAPSMPALFDYTANIQSDVFGAQLFTGSFARQGATQFNPDYVIATGDRVQIRMWGAFNFDQLLTVDPKGNIFLPHVGPVAVIGVRNGQLQTLIDAEIRKVFRANVHSYASLAAAQPVRVFVSGYVNRPGLYAGTSMDSILHYLDQAGGIDTERGSFIEVEIKRGEKVRANANLYDFLTKGVLPLTQLQDGDVIFVSPRKRTVKVSGLAENAKRFEFVGDSLTVSELIRISRPLAEATHARVTRNTGGTRNVEYYPLDQADKTILHNGDELEFTADKKLGTITVRVEGEHQSEQEYVMPHGSRLGELLKKISFSANSEVENLQLYRVSVKARQKQLLEASLRNLESAALTARSSTSSEAALRKEESELILNWVDRARKITPAGQVFLTKSAMDNLLLENGDVLKVPKKDDLVIVGGEVLFPNAIAFDAALSLQDYIQRAGGYSQNAESSRVIVAHRDGSFDESSTGRGFFSSASNDVDIRAGDEIMVLPRIDVKSAQVAKDMTEIIYQIAVAAKVVFGL